MASAYTLYFSDSRKTGNIIVPGTSIGTGKNNYDTSLELIGPGYVNYGSAIAQNFLKLLENFSGPIPPENPIEGQLWYDTSNTNRKILRIHNASQTSRGWPVASGIYQQANDPSLGVNSTDINSNIKDGDLWINLSTGQLNVRSGNQWVLVGPNTITGTQKTGIEAALIPSSQGPTYPIIQKYINGEIVEIISFNEFTPRTVINGFTTIKAGSNLTTRNNARYNGVADRASSLEVSRGIVLKAADILKNRTTEQIHTGTLIIESSGGIILKNSLLTSSIQIANTPQESFLNFDNLSSTLRIGINPNSYIRFNGQYRNIGINTSTSSTSPTLDVNGGGRFKGNLTIEQSGNSALTVIGNEIVQGALTVLGNATFSAQTSVSGVLTLGNLVSGGSIMEPSRNDIYDIGSSTKKFRRVYATEIGDSTSKIYGVLQGSAQKLESFRELRISGQASAITFFDGSQNVNSVLSLTTASISSQPVANSTTGSQTLMVLNTGTASPVLQKISKSTFLSDVYPGLLYTGMIILTAISNPNSMPGFLPCNGEAYNQASYPALFNVINTVYGTGGSGTFRVPDLTNRTVTITGLPLYYYIKT